MEPFGVRGWRVLGRSWGEFWAAEARSAALGPGFGLVGRVGDGWKSWKSAGSGAGEAGRLAATALQCVDG